MDTQLRDLLETAVGEPPRGVDLAVVRRRVRRRRWAESTAAVVGALALLAGVGVVVGAGASGPGQADAVAARAGAPAYYVQQVDAGGFGFTTRVMRTATNAVTAIVRCPWPGAMIPAKDIAAAGNGIFFVGCEQYVNPRRSVGSNVTAARLYRFRVTAAGRVAGFSLVPGGDLGAVSIYRMAAAPGGAEAAVAVGPSTSTSAASERVLVIDTRTGARGTWHNDAGTSGMVLGYVDFFSFTGNGRELAFVAGVRCKHGASACVSGLEVRAVSPALAGGQLTSSRLLFRTTELRGLSSVNLSDALLDPSGSALTVLVYYPRDRGEGWIVSVLHVSAVTGRQLGVLYRANMQNGQAYEYFSQDATGRYIMLDNGGSSPEPSASWIYRGRLIPMIPHDGKIVLYQVW